MIALLEWVDGFGMDTSVKGIFPTLDEALRYANEDDKYVEFDFGLTDFDIYDVAHFMSIEDENKINEAKEKNVPVIVSALYCEDDPVASFLDFKNKDGERQITVKNKAIRVLNKADLVLVPSEVGRNLLLDNGITSPIQVCLPGVNLSRFSFTREDEKEIFYRYFGEDPNKKLVLALGEYSGNMDGINALINAAKKCPNAIFYYIGCDEIAKKSWQLKRMMKHAPKNVHFKGIVPDDVYRSLLMNASLCLHIGYRPLGVVSLVDSMAAKSQIIVRKQAIYPELLEDGVTAYIAEFSETITSLIKDYLEGKIQPTIDNAYKLISKQNLECLCDKLMWFYKQQIQLKKN